MRAHARTHARAAQIVRSEPMRPHRVDAFRLAHLRAHYDRECAVTADVQRRLVR